MSQPEPKPATAATPALASAPARYLNLQPNFGMPGERYRHAYMPGDRFYEMLIEGHRGLADEQSELMNARLVLLLANHIGDLRVLQEAITAARGTLGGAKE